MITKVCNRCGKEFEVPRNGRCRLSCYDCVPFRTRNRVINTESRECSHCHQTKPLNEFIVRSKEKLGRGWICKPCASQHTIKHQRNHKQRCLEYKGGKCQVCGYNKCVRALHFHHSNPNEKDFCLATYRCRAWEIVKAELDKCVLVCSNCHAEIHDGITSCPSEGIFPVMRLPTMTRHDS